MDNFIGELGGNKTLWVAVFSWAAAQIIKIAIELFRTKKINMKLMMSSGGMPSSHTAFVVSLSTAIGIQDGFNSTLFAIAAVFSMVVMYDATGIRRAAGKQARIINILVESFEHPTLMTDEKLKELLGHSPLQVAAGAVLGILMAALLI